MTTQFIPAPDTMDITVRRLDLTFDGVPEYFIQDNPVLTALFCTLSAVFPPGERQFIDSVRYYQKDITDPELSKRIRGFIGQEAFHGKEHDAFNEKLMQMGWRVDLVERQGEFINKRMMPLYSAERQLAQTVAMEHVTAVFANFLMTRPEFLGDNPHPDIHRLFLWHAIEETEHKSVAFDVYQQVSGNTEIRRKEMRFLYPFFITHMLEGTALLLWKKGAFSKFKAWRAAYQALYGKEGMLTVIKPELKAFYREDFHPWEFNNAELATQWIEKLAV